MTEADWWGATDPFGLILQLVDSPAAARKFGLFGLACGRQVERQADDPPDALLGLLDDLADGQADVGLIAEQVPAAPHSLPRAIFALLTGRRRDRDSDLLHLFSVIWFAAEALRDSHSPPDRIDERKTRETVPYLHDVFGPLPFRDVAVDRRWLTSDVLALARGIYDEKAFDRMPVLADALQDAGCTNDELLAHCRAENWEHVRGCWVVDLLLGRAWRE